MEESYLGPEGSQPLELDAVTDESAGGPEGVVETVCNGFWRLKPGVVFRLEETGALLFEPDTDSTAGVNRTGAALLQWRPRRVSFREWGEALSAHYGTIERERIESDLRRFLAVIAPFLEQQDVE